MMEKTLAGKENDAGALNGFAWFCAQRKIGLDKALPVAQKAADLSGRRSIRLPDYDYSQPGAYFITLVTNRRECLFGEIKDDGRGFDFSGRLNQMELDEAHRGPLVIKERVRLIDGELTIESTPGHGSRLEITVPQQREAAYG